MRIYEIILLVLLINVTFTLPSKSEMIENIKRSSKIKGEKKNTFIVIGKLLLDNGYEPTFVAGILANIYYEGSIGRFESSKYKNENRKPQYLKYMDLLHNYREKYSYKLITDVSLKELSKLMELLHSQNWKKGKFGLGCVQWTGERTRKLVQLYVSEAKGKDRINMNEATAAEGKMIINEFNGRYKKIYTEWKNTNLHKIETSKAAYEAGSIVCRKYEVPAGYMKKGDIRGKFAINVYKIMANMK